MKCPTCDHDDTKTEQFLKEQVGMLTRQLMEYKQSPTLRDQFAMAAMPAILAKLEFWGEEVSGISVLAYRQADAMMEARKTAP